MQENLKSGFCGTVVVCFYVCVPSTQILIQLFLELSDNFLIPTDK